LAHSSSGRGRLPAKPPSSVCQYRISSSPSFQQSNTGSPSRRAGKSTRPSSMSFTSTPSSVTSSIARASERASRSTSAAASASSGRDEVYSWSGFVGGLVVYAVWLGIVLLITLDHTDLLALRRPRSWGRALSFCLGAIVAIYAVSALVSALPLPQSPSNEQGLTPTQWEPRYAAAFAANVALFTIVAPFVEELTFRGAGQSLLRFLGRWPSIVLVGIAFGLTHGLVEA